MLSDVESTLRHERRAIYTRLERIADAGELLAIQLDIVEKIRAAEWARAGTARDERDLLDEHENLLRCAADTLAWALLHPHTIRQFAKSTGRPPSLGKGNAGFEKVLAAARKHAANGRLVLISDITRVIKIGDLLLCENREAPSVVECKGQGRPEHVMRGRTGRQMSRVMGTLAYLQHGRAHVHGEDQPRIVVETAIERAFSWAALDRAIDQAMRGGMGIETAGPGDVIWAVRQPPGEDDIPDAPPELRETLGSFGRIYLGVHLKVVEDAEHLLPPPLAWPLSLDQRIALTEGDVVVTHFVDVASMIGRGSPRATIVDVNDRGPYVFKVQLDGDETHDVSYRFLNDVIYGFETIDSMVAGMAAFVEQVAALEPTAFPPKPEGKGPPRVHVIDSLDKARTLSGGESSDVVMVARHVFEQLVSDDPDDPGNGSSP